MTQAKQESWSSRLGVILAVAGSAVGLGNFLRFPGLVSQYGGGAFMIAYFISLVLLGLPICWAEWAMGRYGGIRGYNSCVGIFSAITRHRIGKYIGILGVIVPVVIYMYYVVIESWCLGYALNSLAGNLHFTTPQEGAAFFSQFTGAAANGSAFGLGMGHVGWFLLACFALNYWFIYRGLSKGIELFCMYAMPALIVIAGIVLVRVLTLGTPDPAHPERNVMNGLGFMWNPGKVVHVETVPATDPAGASVELRQEIVGAEPIAAIEALVAAQPERHRIEHITVWSQLSKSDVWLAAAGQIFFSLSVGFGVIITYASYLKQKDDVVLSGLAATSANEFCEVALGGLITIPAAVAFLGVAGAVGGTFGLGFNVLPMVFSLMPAGALFGFLFFFLLFLAAVTSSLSMLQPGIAFLEDAMGINRKQSVAILGFITGTGTLFVTYFSADLKALDTLDFWVGTFLIFLLALVQTVIFGWVMGVEKGIAEANQGAVFPLPKGFGFVIKYVTPAYLGFIAFNWITENILGHNVFTGATKESGYVRDLFGEQPSLVAWLSIILVLGFSTFLLVIVNSSERFKRRLSDAEHTRD